MALGNGHNGVLILDAPDNYVGGDVAGTFNAIGGNGQNGIEIRGATSTGNIVRRSVIGTNLAGTVARGNGTAGVMLDNAPNNIIGVALASGGTSNLISGNGSGIHLKVGSDGTRIVANRIGTDISGNTALGNGTGIYSEAANAIIGSTDHSPWTCDRACNLVSGNTLGNGGIALRGGATAQIQGNFVGVRADGQAVLAGPLGLLVDGTPSSGEMRSAPEISSWATAPGASTSMATPIRRSRSRAIASAPPPLAMRHFLTSKAASPSALGAAAMIRC